MKAILLTIRLKYFYLTYKGIKTLEIRKSCPKNFVGDVYEYVSKTYFEKDLMEIPENEREFFKRFKGKVGLKFTLNKVKDMHKWLYSFKDNEFYEILRKSCLITSELQKYAPITQFEYEKGKSVYAWHIDNLVRFDKPKELSEFYTTRPNNFNEYFTDEIKVNGKWVRPVKKPPQSYQFIEVGE